MKSWLEDFDLSRRLREGIAEQRDARRTRIGAREAQEAQELLEKERALLRQVRAVLSLEDDDSDVRAALDWCAARREAARRAAARRERADAIYNAYYTHDGIQNGLLALEAYAGDEAGDIDDPETLYMKVYTDRLRIVRFLYDRLMARLTAETDSEPGEVPETLTEEQLEPLGWVPVEAGIRSAIQTLQVYADGGALPSTQRSSELYELGNEWEETREILRQNIKLLKQPLPDVEPEDDAIPEGPLLEAITRLMTGEAFEALAQRPDDADDYLKRLGAFVEIARSELLEPFRRQ